MVNDALRTYVIESLQQGYREDQIINVLLAQGWTEEDVTAVLDEILGPEVSEEVMVKRKFGTENKTLFLGALIGGVALAIGMFVFGVYIIYSGPAVIPQDVPEVALDNPVQDIVPQKSSIESEEDVADTEESEPLDELQGNALAEELHMNNPIDVAEDAYPQESAPVSIVETSPASSEDQCSSEWLLDEETIAEMENYQIPESSPYYSNRKNFLKSAIAFAKCESTILDRNREIKGFCNGSCNYVREKSFVFSGLDCNLSVVQTQQIALEFFEVAQSDVTSVSVFKAGSNFQFGDGDHDPDSWYFGFAYEDTSNEDPKYRLHTLSNLQDDPTICTES